MSDPSRTVRAGKARLNSAPFWLAVAIVAYAVLSFSLSGLRYLEFQTSNFDLGIFQQALWSQAHGHGLFEAGDYEVDGASSLLRIHPSLLLYPLSSLYASIPSAWTLFAVQSGVVAVAAIPLYLLTLDLTASPRRSLATAVLYLAWTPLLAANLFDFHLEAVVPLFAFTLFLLWWRAKYVAGFVVALLAMASFEGTTAVVGLTAVFFLLPSDVSGALSARRLSRWAREPRVVASLALLATAAVGFVMLTRWQALQGSILGSYSPITVASVASGGPPGLPIDVGFLSVEPVSKVAYWVTLFALVGFLPFLDARSLVLSGPWVVASLVAPSRFSTFGSQYGFLYAAPIFVGVALGMAALDRYPVRLWLARPAPREPGDAGLVRRWRARMPPRAAILGAVLIGCNLALSPVDPLVVGGGSSGNGYEFGYAVPTGWPGFQKVVALIPPEAPILASDDLFTYVANDVNAYGLSYSSGGQFLFLPFNSAHPPSFVLLSEVELANAPAWLVELLGNATDFGLRATAAGTSAGLILLYEAGYRGGVESFGRLSFVASTYAWPSMIAGAVGRTEYDPNLPEVGIIQGIPGVAGQVWYGPYVTLPAGPYQATITVEATIHDNGSANLSGVPVLKVIVRSFSQGAVAVQQYNLTTLVPGAWEALPLSFELPWDSPRVEVVGYQLSPSVTITLESVLIGPSG